MGPAQSTEKMEALLMVQLHEPTASVCKATLKAGEKTHYDLT